MLHRFFSFRPLLLLCTVWLGICLWCQPAQAESIAPYVRRYLDAAQPVPIKVDETGETRNFSAEALSRGKARFDDGCLYCHIGGSNVPIPPITLSREVLAGATPPRDNLNGFVAFMREPMTYDGDDYSSWCRQVSENWMTRAELEEVAAYVLRAGEKVSSWGRKVYEVE